MPELPEVETVRRMIAPEVEGRVIRDVVLREFAGVLEGPEIVDPASAIIGATITSVQRRGKYLMLPLDRDLWLVVHLRMTGRLLFLPTDSPPVRFEHLAIRLDNGTDLRFGDQRKFGRVRVSLPEEIEALNQRLGPEPFDRRFTGRRLHEVLLRRSGKIKAVLLDQHLIAGLGNIYVDEALHRARIHPEQTAREVTLGEATRLLAAIRRTLGIALENQGTTFSTFENPYGEAGSNARALLVYGKGGRGETCRRCGTPLERSTVAGRGTSFCPKCQVLAG